MSNDTPYLGNLKPYPSYKDSATLWLGPVPEHWQVQRAKYFYREVDERSASGAEELLSVSHLTGVTPRSEKNITMFMAESYVGHKVCKPGDLVINTMWAWMGALGVARQTGIVSPSYGVYRPREGSPLQGGYADRLLRTRPYVDEYACRSTGIQSSRLRLYPEQFLRIRVACPSLEEQHAIIRYLRDVDQRIGRYLRAKQKLIALLHEKKHVAIHGVVTHGLNPRTRFKSAGIDWLPRVPNHWDVRPLKAELRNLNARRVPLSGPERGRMTKRDYDYYGASGVIDRVEDYLFDDDLLLLAEDGANLVLRNLPLAIVARGKFWVNNHAHILKPRRGSIEYFAALLECIDYTPWITGAAQPKLTAERLMAVRVPVPPESEQREISDWIRVHTRELEDGISRCRREVDLVREYRTRLISDVVTGKLDVREAAASLSEEIDVPDQIDEAVTDELDEETEAVTEGVDA